MHHVEKDISKDNIRLRVNDLSQLKYETTRAATTHIIHVHIQQKAAHPIATNLPTITL